MKTVKLELLESCSNDNVRQRRKWSNLDVAGATQTPLKKDVLRIFET